MHVNLNSNFQLSDKKRNFPLQQQVIQVRRDVDGLKNL